MRFSYVWLEPVQSPLTLAFALGAVSITGTAYSAAALSRAANAADLAGRRAVVMGVIPFRVAVDGWAGASRQE